MQNSAVPILHLKPLTGWCWNTSHGETFTVTEIACVADQVIALGHTFDLCWM